MDCFVFRGLNIIKVAEVDSSGEAAEVFDEVVHNNDGSFVKGAEPLAVYEDNKVKKGIYSMLVE